MSDYKGLAEREAGAILQACYKLPSNIPDGAIQAEILKVAAVASQTYALCAVAEAIAGLDQTFSEFAARLDEHSDGARIRLDVNVGPKDGHPFEVKTDG